MKNTKKYYDYVLQLGFDKQTENYIQHIKDTLKANNIRDRQKNWRPHITIDMYNCDDEKLFIEKVENIVSNIKAENLACKNLNNFDNETLYIEPFNKEGLQNIKHIFNDGLAEFRLQSRINREYKPHITLCSTDNIAGAIEISTLLFKPFECKAEYLWIYTPAVKLVKEYKLFE